MALPHELTKQIALKRWIVISITFIVIIIIIIVIIIFIH